MLGCCRRCFQACDIPAEQQAEQGKGSEDVIEGEERECDIQSFLISSQCFSNCKQLSALVLHRGSF